MRECLGRQLAEVVGECLDDLKQYVDGETVREKEAEVLDDFGWGLDLLALGGLLLADVHLALHPLEQRQDALEGTPEEDIVADTQEELHVVEDFFG